MTAISGLMSNAKTRVATETTKSAGANDTLEQLKKKHPELTLTAENVSKGSSSGEGVRGNVAISPEFLKKMGTDPKAAAKGEEILNGAAQAEEWLRNRVRADGSELVGFGMMVDSDGNVSSWSQTTTTAESPTGSSDVLTESQKKKKKEEEEKRDKITSDSKSKDARSAVLDLQKLLAERVEKRKLEAAENSADSPLNVLA